MNENTRVAAIRYELGSHPDVRLFRFQCGTFQLADGRYITVGIPGMSDLLGWHTIRITPDMVGKWIAVFTAIEVKNVGAKTQKTRLAAQQSFLSVVKAHGGFSGFAVDAEQARQILNQPLGAVHFPTYGKDKETT